MNGYPGKVKIGASKKIKCSDGVHYDEYEAGSGRYFERTIFQVVHFLISGTNLYCYRFFFSGFDAAFDFPGFHLVTVTDFSSGSAGNPVLMVIDLDCSTTGT